MAHGAAAGESLFPAEDVAPEGGMTEIALCGERLRLDPSGALWWHAARTLVVADMHLEKGSAYAARGQMLPPYDSVATLARLACVIGRFRPKRLIALGDSFHDVRAGERMDEAAAAALSAIAAAQDMVWVAGNHDPEVPGWLPGRRLPQLVEGPLAFRHEPGPDPSRGEVAGHLHPVAKVVGERGRVRRKAFVTDGERLLLPAFGAYAGGLNLLDGAVASLFAPGRIVAHVCGAKRVYSVGGRRLAGD